MSRITSARDPALLAALQLHQGLHRAAAGRYLVEGIGLIRQALAAGRLVEAFYTSDDDGLAAELSAAGLPARDLDAKLLPRLIGTHYETSITAVGVVRRELLTGLPASGLTLAAEGIQDPRNVGVLVRTAEAAGVTAAAFSDDSADPFSRGAVRSSTGSVLRQPLFLSADLAADLRQLRSRGCRVVATSAHAPRPCWQTDLRGDVVVVVGNESSGLSPAVTALADGLVGLPVAGGASSLNVTVAAGAILYEALRQRAAEGHAGASGVET